MYDTHLGQFLNADPIILDEQNSQNFALYSYVLNNPLKYTDPSGYTQQGGPASAAIAGQTGKMLQMQLLETNNNINAIKEGAEQPFFLANGILYIPTTGGATFTYGNRAPSYDGYLREVVVSGARPGSNSNRFQFKSVSNANYQLDFGGRGGELDGGGLSGTDKAGYGLNVFGFTNGAKTEIIDYAVRSGSSQAGIRAELQVLGKTGTRYLSAAKGLGFMAGVAGVAVTGIDAYNKGQWQNHHTADVLIGVGSLYLLTGPVGWAVGGGYFLIDVSIKSYTGKSITENLFDKP